MNKLCEWWRHIDWEEVLARILVIFIIAFLPIIAGALVSISTTLGRVERDFSIVQELQKDVKHLNRLTECLEPAVEPEPRPEDSLPLLPEIE